VIDPGSRTRSYAALVAVVTALFLTGLAIPFVFGDPVPSTTSTVRAGTGSSSSPSATEEAAAQAPPGDTSQPGGSSANPSSGKAGGGAVGGSTASGTSGGGAAGSASATAAKGPPVRIGFTLVDLGAARDAGFVLNFPGPAVQQGWWQAAIDEVNKGGGLNGRPIAPVYRNVNVLNADDAQQTCLQLTEDDKVFAVVGVLYFAVADECVVNGHKTPLSTIGPNDDDTFASGLLATLMPKTSRVIANFGGDLKRQNLLAGKSVGILTDSGSDPRGRAIKQLEGLVKSAGPKDVRTATLGADLTTAAAQTSVVVSNWRNSGVDTVLFIVNPQYAIAFVQNADRQFWKPKYDVSDFASIGNSDIATAGMSEGFDGALSITSTRVNRPPNDALNRCVDILRRNGHPVTDPVQAPAAGQQCDMLNVFVAGARAAGPTLTHATYSQGVQRAGSIPASRVGDGAFGPNKFDLADQVTSVRWHYDCGCYRPEGDFRPGAG
jgi:ABC-type branched-subunit amino acid transport system substrate-binding protein